MSTLGCLNIACKALSTTFTIYDLNVAHILMRNCVSLVRQQPPPFALQVQSLQVFSLMFLPLTNILSYHVSVSNWLSNPPCDNLDKAMMLSQPFGV